MHSDKLDVQPDPMVAIATGLPVYDRDCSDSNRQIPGRESWSSDLALTVLGYCTPSLSCLALEVSAHPGRFHLDQT